MAGMNVRTDILDQKPKPSGRDLAYRAVAAVLGGPVDLTSMVMKPFGYDTEKPVLGSEWIGQQMQNVGLVSEARDPLQEFAASIMVPSPGGLAAGVGKGVALLPAVVGMTKVGKVDDALRGVGKVVNSLPAPKVVPREVPTEEAVMNYVLGEATPWNEALRTGRWDSFADDASPQGLAEVVGNIKAFDKYLSKGMKASGQQLHRVVDASYSFGGKTFDVLKIGDTFVDPGFVSTTTSKKYAEHVASNTNQPRLFRIVLPTSGKVPARRIRDEELDPNNFAKEITLGRDQKFKVVGKTEENGLPVTILELQAK
jgi:hypothetical protein